MGRTAPSSETDIDINRGPRAQSVPPSPHFKDRDRPFSCSPSSFSLEPHILILQLKLNVSFSRSCPPSRRRLKWREYTADVLATHGANFLTFFVAYNSSYLNYAAVQIKICKRLIPRRNSAGGRGSTSPPFFLHTVIEENARQTRGVK